MTQFVPLSDEELIQVSSILDRPDLQYAALAKARYRFWHEAVQDLIHTDLPDHSPTGPTVDTLAAALAPIPVPLDPAQLGYPDLPGRLTEPSDRLPVLHLRLAETSYHCMRCLTQLYRARPGQPPDSDPTDLALYYGDLVASYGRHQADHEGWLVLCSPCWLAVWPVLNRLLARAVPNLLGARSLLVELPTKLELRPAGRSLPDWLLTAMVTVGYCTGPADTE